MVYQTGNSDQLFALFKTPYSMKKGTIVDMPIERRLGLDYYKIRNTTVEEAIESSKRGNIGTVRPQFPRQLIVKLRLRWPWLTFITFKNWVRIYRRYFFGAGDYYLRLRKRWGGLEFIASNKTYTLPMIVSLFYYREYGSMKDMPAGATIIDLGGNIGTFSALVLSEIPNARVFAYEPNPESLQHFKRNLDHNKLTRYVVWNKAVAGKRERRTFYMHEGMMYGSDGLWERQGKKGIDMECITLEDVFKENSIQHCDLLKVDIEGAEYEMFFNTPDAILEKIDKIIFEWHLTDPRYTLKDLTDFLTSKGFNLQLDYPTRSLVTATRIQ